MPHWSLGGRESRTRARTAERFHPCHFSSGRGMRWGGAAFGLLLVTAACVSMLGIEWRPWSSPREAATGRSAGEAVDGDRSSSSSSSSSSDASRLPPAGQPGGSRSLLHTNHLEMARARAFPKPTRIEETLLFLRVQKTASKTADEVMAFLRATQLYSEKAKATYCSTFAFSTSDVPTPSEWVLAQELEPKSVPLRTLSLPESAFRLGGSLPDPPASRRSRTSPPLVPRDIEELQPGADPAMEPVLDLVDEFAAAARDGYYLGDTIPEAARKFRRCAPLDPPTRIPVYVRCNLVQAHHCHLVDVLRATHDLDAVGDSQKWVADFFGNMTMDERAATRRVIVLLRDPVMRVLSELKHHVLRRLKSIWDFCMSETVARDYPSFFTNSSTAETLVRRFVEHPDHSIAVHNRQTKFLSGLTLPPWEPGSTQNMTRWREWHHRALATARRVVEFSDVLLLQDRLVESMALLLFRFRFVPILPATIALFAHLPAPPMMAIYKHAAFDPIDLSWTDLLVAANATITHFTFRESADRVVYPPGLEDSASMRAFLEVHNDADVALLAFANEVLDHRIAAAQSWIDRRRERRSAGAPAERQLRGEEGDGSLAPDPTPGMSWEALSALATEMARVREEDLLERRMDQNEWAEPLHD